MPGAPWMGRGKPMHERSNGEVWWMFVVLPLAFAAFLWGLAVWHILDRGATLTATEWCQAIFTLVIFGTLTPLSLCAVAVQELRKRAQQDATTVAPRDHDDLAKPDGDG